MKLMLNRLIPGVLLFASLSLPAAAQTKFATVNLGRVFTNYWKYTQASAALDDRKNEFAKREKQLMDDYQKDKDDYQKLLADANNQAVSAEERNKRQQAAADKLKEIKSDEDNITQFEREARSKLSDQVARMHDNLISEIRAAINSKAKQGGFALVLDTTEPAATPPTVLYSDGENDLTESVLKQLNANAPISPPPSGDKKSGSNSITN